MKKELTVLGVFQPCWTGHKAQSIPEHQCWTWSSMPQ